MTHIPHDDVGSAFGDWAAEAVDQLASVAQGALDLAAWALVAGLFWMAAPENAAKPQIAPGPMATSVCVADCIETVALTSGS